MTKITKSQEIKELKEELSLIRSKINLFIAVAKYKFGKSEVNDLLRELFIDKKTKI